MTKVNEDAERVTLVLSRENNAWLDEQTAAIRRQNGASVSRSGLIRGILQALADVPIGLERCRSESDVRTLVSFHLKAFYDRRVDGSRTEVRT